MTQDLIENPPQMQIQTIATPIEILRMAVERGADVAMLERLMELQTKWEANEARKAFNVAFSAFKAQAIRIIKNKTTEAGPLIGRKYAELFAIVNAVTPALSEHGLSASWRISKDEPGWVEVTCTLQHSGGHSESVSMGGPPDMGGAKSAIQARASTVTYLERYTLKAITGLAEQNDDKDGAGGALSERIEQERKRELKRAGVIVDDDPSEPTADAPDWRQAHRTALEGATTLPELAKAFATAQGAARLAKSQEAMEAFIALKDKKKAALETHGAA